MQAYFLIQSEPTALSLNKTQYSLGKQGKHTHAHIMVFNEYVNELLSQRHQSRKNIFYKKKEFFMRSTTSKFKITSFKEHVKKTRRILSAFILLLLPFLI